MSPDDPRHGTEAGSTAHRRAGETPCAPCKNAHRIGQTLRQLYPHKCASIGSQRRIQALQSIGYSRERIGRELGYTDAGGLSYLMRSETMLQTTAARIAEVYDRLCMTVPSGPGANRARTWARRHGFHPPLAWDDIDDPDATPNLGDPDIQVRVGRPVELTIEDAEWLADGGASLTEVINRLGVKRDTFRDTLRSAGRNDLYWRLANREPNADDLRAARDGIKRSKERVA